MDGRLYTYIYTEPRVSSTRLLSVVRDEQNLKRLTVLGIVTGKSTRDWPARRWKDQIQDHFPNPLEEMKI